MAELTQETIDRWNGINARAERISTRLHSIASGDVDGLAGKALELVAGGQASAAARQFDDGWTVAAGYWQTALSRRSEEHGSFAADFLTTACTAAEKDFLGIDPGGDGFDVGGADKTIKDTLGNIADGLKLPEIPWWKIGLAIGGVAVILLGGFILFKRAAS